MEGELAVLKNALSEAEAKRVFYAGLDNLRLLKGELVGAGDDDAVPGLPDLLQGHRHLVVLVFDAGELGQQAHQVAVVVDGKA